MRLRLLFLLFPLFAFLTSCSGGGSGTVTPTPIPVGNAATVDFGVTNQTIRGFGGSSAWISNFSSGQADALFGSGSGQLGLSILRVRIDPSSDTGGAANWGTELHNAQMASARGASVIATPWTPPADMKTNSNTVGGTLNTASYGSYANYLQSFVSYMASGGVNLYAISMQNEPDANVSYESCGWTGDQMDAWVAGNAATLTTKLMMPESESFTTSLSDAALNDASAVGHIAIVAGHIYGTSAAPYANAVSKGKELWMTEHFQSGTGISGALALAREVHDSLTVANYNAYLWWWIENYTGGGYTSGLMDDSHTPTLNGYALAQFSRFVRPGYVRVNATANPQSGVYVSAYKGGGHFVIVAINTGAASVSEPFRVQNGALTSVTPYQTSAAANLAAQGSVAVSGGAFTFTLPGQSITTFVQ